MIEGPPEPIPGDGGTDDDEDDDGGEGPDAAAVAQEQADKKAKADANKKKQTDADSAVVAKYMGKTVKAPAGEGGDGKVVAVVRRKVGGRKQFRIQVKWPDLDKPRWYSRAEIDANM